MASVDPVAVAKRIVAEAVSFPFLWDSTSEMEKVALCRVVIAASEFVAAELQVDVAQWETTLAYSDAMRDINEARDALAAALRGGGGEAVSDTSRWCKRCDAWTDHDMRQHEQPTTCPDCLALAKAMRSTFALEGVNVIALDAFIKEREP